MQHGEPRNREGSETFEPSGLLGGLHIGYHIDAYPGAINAHEHLAHELIFVVSGAARYTLGQTIHDLQAGSVLMVGRLESHRIDITQVPFRRVYLLIDFRFGMSVLKSPLLMQSFANRPAQYRQIICHPAVFAEFLNTLDAIALEQLQPGAFHQEIIAALFSQLMINLYRSSPSADRSIALTPCQEQVLRVQQYIDLHATDSLSLSMLARQFYINSYTLSRTFHQLTGMTLTRYIAKLRLAIAREMLLDSSFRVQDIAVSVGFGDVNTFIRLFRREFGQTPLSYRRNPLLTDDYNKNTSK